MKVLLFFWCVWLAAVSLAQTSEQVLNKHLNAHGQALWNQIPSAEITAHRVNADYQSVPAAIRMKGTSKMRVDIRDPKIPLTVAISQVDAWKKEAQKTESLDLQEKLLYRGLFPFGSPLAAFQDQLNFLGLVDLEGTLCLAFEMNDANAKRTFYLNQTDYRLLTEKVSPPDGAAWAAFTRTYEKYRKINGLLVPAAVIVKSENLYFELVFDDVLLGTGFQEALFVRPE